MKKIVSFLNQESKASSPLLHPWRWLLLRVRFLSSLRRLPQVPSITSQRHCYANLSRVFIAGDSAGANISHTLMVRVGSLGLAGANVVGMVLVHPYFGGTTDDGVWLYMCPNNDCGKSRGETHVVISSETGLSARIFLPDTAHPIEKLPLLFYIHGGGFCMRSAFGIDYHNYVSTLVSQGNAIAVSPWLINHADFDRIFIVGDSAGGNISHTMAVRVGTIGLAGVRVVGVVMVHPFFGGTIDDEMWMYMCTDDDKMWLYMCPTNGGLEDPRMKPAAEDLARLGCEKVLVFVAEKDHLREVGWNYYEELKKSGWKGTVEIVENHGEEHCFHLHDLSYEKSVDLIKQIASFINRE
ncbi:unnamed protein product, partial [Vitis vinifera]